MNGGGAPGRPIDAALGLLACPVCGHSLGRHDRVLRCANRHSFDLARQGYVNLLGTAPPANADTAQMLAARDRFLGSGAYWPIRDAVVAVCTGAARVAEVGAGTGHYLAAVLAAHQRQAHLAIDVSTAAAKRTARQGLASVVADTWAGLPLLPGCLDRVLCVFAPRSPAEFARVLAPGGEVVVVTPGPRHLQRLRSLLPLLGVPVDKLQRVDASFTEAGLQGAGRDELEYELELSPGMAADVVGMGPNAFHGQHAVAAEPVHETVSVLVSRYRQR